MINMALKLKRREEEGRPIMTGIVGMGQMGTTLVGQISLMKGMRPAVVVDHKLPAVRAAFTRAGYKEGEDFEIAETVAEGNRILAAGKFVGTLNDALATQCDAVECSVDATGVPEAGARIALDAINAGKHIVMLNVETDVCIGHILYKLAQNAGVIYTGTAGDEPGAVMELYDFAEALGFDVRVVGKGKNNPVILDCTPESVADIARGKGATPRMICAFKDGTKTMVEMTAMANATGFVPDITGAHGASSDTKHLGQVLSLKSEGGVLNHYGVVEYINGVAPGVFVIFHTDEPDSMATLKYIEMGDGPNYALYRPYHLTSIETPLTIAKACIDHEPTLVPRKGLVAEVITVAKRDLKAGETLDGIGGYTIRGTFMEAKAAQKCKGLPMGMVNAKT
ncbi:MAG: NAD(P)-dependent oxidoreductase, partial [Eubacteriaceae bacterium]|nr:NAD(P)-dependent oxidoreductase [Eubacteriaceae bacterium]